MKEIGEVAYYKPREIKFLHIYNVRDYIEDIQNFLSYYSDGGNFSQIRIDTSKEFSNNDIYSFSRDEYASIECSDIEDTERYIVFDPDRKWIEFDVYTPEEFEKNFSRRMLINDVIQRK